MADYLDSYLFTSNVTNFVCPAWALGGITFGCQPPNACATDPRTLKQYCCDFGDVCWTISSVCAGDGSTFTCSTGSDTWCCLRNKEICTQSAGQANICWSSAHDILNNISSSVLNRTYSSLSFAQPSASSFTFDPLKLIAQTQTTSTETTSTETTSTESTTATNTATNSTKPSNDNPSPNSLSGGAIAGIVIGVVAAIAIACLAAFLLVRHSQRKQNPKDTQAVQEIHGDSKRMPQEMQADTSRVTELPGA